MAPVAGLVAAGWARPAPAFRKAAAAGAWRGKTVAWHAIAIPSQATAFPSQGIAIPSQAIAIPCQGMAVARDATAFPSSVDVGDISPLPRSLRRNHAQAGNVGLIGGDGSGMH